MQADLLRVSKITTLSEKGEQKPDTDFHQVGKRNREKIKIYNLSESLLGRYCIRMVFREVNYNFSFTMGFKHF